MASRPQRPSYRWKLVAGLGALAYVLTSLNVLFFLWLGQAFCDIEEGEDCTLSWTPGRVALWAGWTALGLAVMISATVTLRPSRGPLAGRHVAATCGAALVLFGLALALLTESGDHPALD